MTILDGATSVGVGVIASVLCPVLPGTIQRTKAHLQGRRGTSIVQPYRELRRLWRKGVYNPDGTTMIYRYAPTVVVATLACCLVLLPITASQPAGILGGDAIVLIGLLALGRFMLAAAAWDTGSGFALMGASRDLTFGIFVESLFVVTLLTAMIHTGSTDLHALISGTAGTAIWQSPVPWCGALAFMVLVVAETGRQPVDNPDTHLELTMVHEGPLLEYAGRDLAYLHWAAAARHWVMIVIVAQVFLPHPTSPILQVATLVPAVIFVCFALALTETTFAKLPVLRVPALISTATLLALIGLLIGVSGVAQ